jgi:hypothetical protein
MDLKDSIKEEREETVRLMSELGLEQEEQLESNN